MKKGCEIDNHIAVWSDNVSVATTVAGGHAMKGTQSGSFCLCEDTLTVSILFKKA